MKRMAVLFTVLGLLGGGAASVRAATFGPPTTRLSARVNPGVIAFDAAGDRFMRAGGQVIETAPDGSVRSVGSGFVAPVSVAADGTGDVYVVDVAPDRVVRVAPDGTQTTIATGGHPDAVAVAPSGAVYVARYTSDSLLRIAPDGTRSTLGSGLSGARGVAVGPHGAVFVTAGEDVARLAPDGRQSLLASGVAGLTAAIAVDPAGTVDVAVRRGGGSEPERDNVIEIAPDGSRRTSPIAVCEPIQIAFDPAGDLFATGACSTLDELRSDGTTVELDPDFAIAGLAVGGAGTLFAGGDTQVLKVTPDGALTTLATGFERVTAVARHDRQTYVTDAGTGTVVDLAADGSRTTVASGFADPVGIAADPAGDLFVADAGSADRVVQIAPDGTQTTVASGLADPSAIAVDGAGDVYVAEAGDGRVVRFAADGTRTRVAGGLDDLDGIAVDSAGDVFVTQSTQTGVVMIVPDGSQTAIGHGGVFPAQAVAVDRAGDLFVQDPYEVDELPRTG